ncbi:glycosyltransferase family 1 protein [Hazenella sp. IB182353]|uniref:glycosyltransferase n=1 Tax=Polycladospora coralii TaxID=2771432 RepID=UPI0017473D18|nr:glycosyltransferase [Polycladospora coralii]MBS7529630.1 glycosyltransferase family 1 protein [Polycladospora coralii]
MDAKSITCKNILMISLQVGNGNSRGHMNPLISVAQQLVAWGHRVHWLALPHNMPVDVVKQLTSDGIEVIDSPPLSSERVKKPAELAKLALDTEKNWQAYQSFLLDPIEEQLDETMKKIKAIQPDVIALDTIVYTGKIAAHLLHVPYVGICAGLKLLGGPDLHPDYMGNLTPLLPLRAMIFKKYRMNAHFRLLEAVSPYANVVFTTKDFVMHQSIPNHTFLVGPSMPLQNRGGEGKITLPQIKHRPLIYMAFGSVLSKEPLADLINPLLEVASMLDMDFLIVSEYFSANPIDLSPNVVIEPMVPQLEVLNKADVFITHGGANSIMEGLSYGVPMIVVPLSSDQPLQGRLVEEAHVGITIQRKDFTSDSIQQAIRSLLDPQSPYHHHIQSIQQAYARQNGRVNAAHIILEEGSKHVRTSDHRSNW